MIFFEDNTAYFCFTLAFSLFSIYTGHNAAPVVCDLILSGLRRILLNNMNFFKIIPAFIRKGEKYGAVFNTQV